MRSLAAILFFASLVPTAFSQAAKPKAAAAKPKPPAAKKLNETTEWEKAIALTDPTQRIAALRKFVANFPRSTRLTEASSLLAAAEAGRGSDRLAVGEHDEAIKFIRAAIKDTPKPIPEQLFTETLSKLPAKLYFRGLRDEGIEIAKALEAKTSANVSQLLTIANFYLSIENGAEATRVADNVIKADANSAAAYQTLGLANRVDFKLDESAAAYAKALELEPDSLTARRGLAEMKRSLGQADKAATFYREILAKDESNVPARTGLIMALFDAGERADAEAELAKSLEANPGNVILLASAAYWYAAHGEGGKAVEFAQKAVDSDPRFIWSHIALARGLLVQNKPLDAERILLAARRYGNFPTLQYEIASARLAAGLYRDAAEELSKSFSVKNGGVHTDLGGRVAADAKNFTDLVGSERKASLFSPTAADSAESAAQLKALLEFDQILRSPEAKAAAVTSAADEFVRGDDKMKVHRQIFAASELLEKKVALAKAIEIAQAAPASLDAGLDVPQASVAVMASELYDNRAIAMARGEFVNVPVVAKPTLSAVLRGRIEEITGWAHYQMDDTAQSVVHLRRATGVLPVDSAWWRSSMWRLGTALSVSGNDAEALDAYIKSYKSGGPDAMRYATIAALYKRVKGNTVGLERRIGPDPSKPPAEAVAKKLEPVPEPKSEMPFGVSVESKPSLTPEPMAQNSPTAENSITSTPSPIATVEAIPEPMIKDVPVPAESPTEMPTASPTLAVETPTSEASPSPTPDETKPAIVPEVSQTPTPEPTPVIQKEPESTPAESPTQMPSISPTLVVETATSESSQSPVPGETKRAIVPDVSQSPTPEPTDDVQKTPESTPQETPTEARTTATPKELFPPVIITIPAPQVAKPKTDEATPTPSATPDTKAPEPKPTETPEPKPTETPTADARNDDTAVASPSPTAESTPEIKPCTVNVNPESVSLKAADGVLAVIVKGDTDQDMTELKGVSGSPENVNVRREMIEGLKTSALFVVRSTSRKTGVYQVTFEMPCGKKEIIVRVK